MARIEVADARTYRDLGGGTSYKVEDMRVSQSGPPGFAVSTDYGPHGFMVGFNAPAEGTYKFFTLGDIRAMKIKIGSRIVYDGVPVSTFEVNEGDKGEIEITYDLRGRVTLEVSGYCPSWLPLPRNRAL